MRTAAMHIAIHYCMLMRGNLVSLFVSYWIQAWASHSSCAEHADIPFVCITIFVQWLILKIVLFNCKVIVLYRSLGFLLIIAISMKILFRCGIYKQLLLKISAIILEFGNNITISQLLLLSRISCLDCSAGYHNTYSALVLPPSNLQLS